MTDNFFNQSRTQHSEFFDIAAKLKAAWTQALYREYEQICYHYHIKLGAPLITVEDLSSKWGSWDPHKRQISISSELIKNHTWDKVIMILKHEMAHQIVDEHFKVREHHGPWFKKAAQMLGIDSFARISDLDLSSYSLEKIEQALSDEDMRLLRRVEKLLSLANSANEHEALLAMKKVRELYQNYDFDYFGLLAEKNHICKTIITGKKRLPRHYSLLAVLLNEHFQVRVIFSHLYDAKKLDTFQTLQILGASHHVSIADYVFSFLLSRLESEWRQHGLNYQQSSRRTQADFYFGIIQGFKQKLASLDQTPSADKDSKVLSQKNALMIQIDHDADQYVKFKFPRLRKTTFSTSTTDQTAVQEGMRRGRSINLSKAISQSDLSGSPKYLS